MRGPQSGRSKYKTGVVSFLLCMTYHADITLTYFCIYNEFVTPILKTFVFLSRYPIPGRALNFFSGRGVRPGFPKCGACELTFASEKGGLWAENFQLWGLVSWKFPNLGACELKISKFGGLRAKIWIKIEAVEAKITKFSQKGVLWTDSFAWNGTLASGRRCVKRGSSGPHIPIPPF